MDFDIETLFIFLKTSGKRLEFHLMYYHSQALRLSLFKICQHQHIYMPSKNKEKRSVKPNNQNNNATRDQTPNVSKNTLRAPLLSTNIPVLKER